MKTKNLLTRPLLTAGLALSIAFTGGIIVPPASAYAAEEEAFSTLSIEEGDAPIDLIEDAVQAEASTFSISATTADRIISTGNRYLGVPYKFGAKAGSTSSFDCSSFTQYVYKKFGISLKRTSRSQATQGKYVSRSNLRKGDLVFFSTRTSGGKIAHVGIYAGNGKILHTYGAGGVKYSSINSGWWSSHYITARRVI